MPRYYKKIMHAHQPIRARILSQPFNKVFLSVLSFSCNVSGRVKFDFPSPFIDILKKVLENSREFPEKSSHILKKSELIIDQHIQQTTSGLSCVFFSEIRARGKIACIELLFVTTIIRYPAVLRACKRFLSYFSFSRPC